jgi:hypothetical protein
MAGRAGSSPAFSAPQPALQITADGGEVRGDALRDAGAKRDKETVDLQGTPDVISGRDAEVEVTKEEAKDLPPEAENPRASAHGDCGLPEKDIAREAWRKNIPTICLGGSGRNQKASIYLPLKGTTADATYDYRRKQRLVRIIAPSAVSQLTMVQYKLRRHGFRDLKLAAEGNGSKFRLSLEKGFSDPVVELKESFIRVVISVPTSDAE